MPSKHPRLNDRDWLLAAITAKPLRHVADDLGVSYYAVRMACQRFELTIPPRQGYVYTEESRRRKSEAQKAAYRRKYPNGRFGAEHPGWKGGRRILNGYVDIYKPEHPRARNGCYVFEHILVMEAHLGRYLTKSEIVHHINHDRADNRIENLEVKERGKHVADHFAEGKRTANAETETARLKTILDKHGIDY